MTARRIEANGIEIAYEDVGEGERPLVLVHGFTGFRRDFEGQLAALGRLGRTLAPDLRGHGETTKLGSPAAYDFRPLVDELVAFLDALALPAADWLGHSMAGLLVLRLALAHPDRVASLILMDTAGRGMDWIDRELVARAGRLGREAGMDVLARVMRARAANDAGRSAADRRVEAEWGEERFWAWRTARVVAMDPQAYEPLAQALRDHESLLPRLGEISCPTLVMVGAEDEAFREPARELAAGIPGARQAILRGAAHQPQNEAPEAWLAAVREHLRAARAQP